MKLAIYISATMVALILLFGTLIGLAPKHQAALLRDSLDSTLTENEKAWFPGDSIDRIREISFKNALLTTSESDSIAMVINLADSTIQLYIKGVMIHATPLTSLEVDNWLLQMPTPYFTHAYSGITQILSESSTIVKEPIVVREAPKDPTEAAANAYEPDTLIQNPAFLDLLLSSNLLLTLEQDEDPTSLDQQIHRKFNRARRINQLSSQLGSALTFHIPSYTPQIKMSLPVKDLRAIYRALPREAAIILYIPENLN